MNLRKLSSLSYRTTCIVGLLATAFCPSNARAIIAPQPFDSGIISFTYSSPGEPVYTSGPGAIGSAGDIWNAISITTPGAWNLGTTTGAATAAVWTFSSGGGIGESVYGTYGPLFNSSCAIYSAAITGLVPGQAYNLYLYNSAWNMVWSVNGVDFSTSEMSNKQGTYINALTDGVDYDVETVVADPKGAMTFSDVSAQFGTPYISSWQLTPAPEPSIYGLLAAGAVCLAWRARRRGAVGICFGN